MIKRFAAVAAAVCLAAAGARAQGPVSERVDSLKSHNKVITFGDGPQLSRDSVRSLLDEFYINQFQHSMTPDAPYFIFMSRDSKLVMGIGGSLQARAWYSWGGYNPTSGFVPSEIPLGGGGAGASRRALTGNVNESSLFFKVIGEHSFIGPWQVYIKAKFGGPSRTLKLSKAYVIIRDWTVGYANSTFEDPAAQPFTIDEQGPNAEISDTDILVRWMHTFTHGITAAASLELPQEAGLQATAQSEGATGCIPTLGAFLQWSWAKDQHLRLSGIVRSLEYRDLVTGHDRTRVGWGLKASSVWAPADGPVTLYLNALYGHGIASITNDLADADLDLIASPTRPGRAQAPALAGAFAGVQYNISPSFFAAVSASELRFLPSGHPDPSTYRYGLYGTATLGWYVTERLLVGAELDLGCHKAFSGAKEWAHRVGLTAQVDF